MPTTRQRLEDVRDEVGGSIRVSRRGVPHLVIGNTSVAWFASFQSYRVFHPYPSHGRKQSKHDARSADDVVVALKDNNYIGITEGVQDGSE